MTSAAVPDPTSAAHGGTTAFAVAGRATSGSATTPAPRRAAHSTLITGRRTPDAADGGRTVVAMGRAPIDTVDLPARRMSARSSVPVVARRLHGAGTLLEGPIDAGRFEATA